MRGGWMSSGIEPYPLLFLSPFLRRVRSSFLVSLFKIKQAPQSLIDFGLMAC